MSSRNVIEGRQTQGVDEKIIYSVDTTPWGTGAITNIVVTAKDVTNNFGDVSADVTSGAASEVSGVITLPKIQSLTAGHLYRVEVKYDQANNTRECWFEIQAEM
jgi:hypothetical protein